MTKQEAINHKEFLLDMCIAYAIQREEPVNGWNIERVRDAYKKIMKNLAKGVYK